MGNDSNTTAPPLEAGLQLTNSYRREMPVTLERMFENALDWEHLPWLHASSFSAIECLDAGAWGWKAYVTGAPAAGGGSFNMELLLDRTIGRWISRILNGSGAGNEIWTHAHALGEGRIEVVVDFYVSAALDTDAAQALGQIYPLIYQGLYNEDEMMMVERQAQLNTRAGASTAAPESLSLGPVAEVRKRVPLTVNFGGAPFRLVEVDGALVAHSTVCPHMLGPLGEADVEKGCVRCPWHGYVFDVQSGCGITNAKLDLSPAPQVHIDSETQTVSLRNA